MEIRFLSARMRLLIATLVIKHNSHSSCTLRLNTREKISPCARQVEELFWFQLLL
ncbi:MAG: hypothetical protein RLY17_48 [Pseudomonadota bacterium]|jgi:hypothetical protein